MKDRPAFKPVVLQRMGKVLLLALFTGIPIVGWLGFAQKPDSPAKPKLAVSIKPQHVADALRAVIASEREVYTKLAAERPADKPVPNPCEVFRLNSEATASKGVEFSYVLRSLKPISRRNAPETDLERKGLEFISSHPGQAYYGEELLGGRWYFTAVYADVAIHSSCVACHNQHQDSPRKDFKPGEVIGGVVVRVALEL